MFKRYVIFIIIFLIYRIYRIYIILMFYLTGDKTKLTKMVQMAWTFVNDR